MIDIIKSTVTPRIMQKLKTTFDDYNKVMANVDKPKISKNIMTRYEFDQIIGNRANQLAHGAIAFIDMSGIVTKSNMELRKVALQELSEGKLPYIIGRMMPNGKMEYYRIRDMDLTAVQHMMR
jgi:DNA-directed RNA polymerase subunit K/omega